MRAGAHLRQSGLLVADFGFADGRQLLQGVAVVGERPRQARELRPSYGGRDRKDRVDNEGQESGHHILSRFLIDLKANAAERGGSRNPPCRTRP